MRSNFNGQHSFRSDRLSSSCDLCLWRLFVVAQNPVTLKKFSELGDSVSISSFQFWIAENILIQFLGKSFWSITYARSQISKILKPSLLHLSNRCSLRFVLLALHHPHTEKRQHRRFRKHWWHQSCWRQFGCRASDQQLRV